MSVAEAPPAPPFHDRTNGTAALYGSEAPSGASQIKPEDDLARVLSPTQVATYLDCPAKWWYKHALHLPERKSTNLGIGIAFHDAVMENFRQKLETREDLPAIGVRAIFRCSWESLKDTLEFATGENADELADTGEALVDEYISKVAPRIQPAAVEQDVRGDIGGVKVRGRIDVLDIEGRIIDAKTAGRKPTGIAPNYRFQVATYVALHGQASGTVRLDTVTKTKTIQVVEQSFTIVESDLKSGGCTRWRRKRCGPDCMCRTGIRTCVHARTARSGNSAKKINGGHVDES